LASSSKNKQKITAICYSFGLKKNLMQTTNSLYEVWSFSDQIQFFKGAMCKKVEYLLTEMQYDIHNYGVFSGV